MPESRGQRVHIPAWVNDSRLAWLYQLEPAADLVAEGNRGTAQHRFANHQRAGIVLRGQYEQVCGAEHCRQPRLVDESQHAHSPGNAQRCGLGLHCGAQGSVSRVHETSIRHISLGEGAQHVYVALGSEDEVARLRPDLNRLAELEGVVGVNCFAGAGGRWKTRMFAPASGVPEDPATGSAAGPLALHLARHGRIAFGDEIEITQGVEIDRPSTLYARADGSADNVERVEVGGAAVVIARGELQVAGTVPERGLSQ